MEESTASTLVAQGCDALQGGSPTTSYAANTHALRKEDYIWARRALLFMVNSEILLLSIATACDIEAVETHYRG